MYLLPEDPSGERRFMHGVEGSYARGGPLFHVQGRLEVKDTHHP